MRARISIRTYTSTSRILVNMVAEHGEGPWPRACGELGFVAGRGIDVLTVNDPWAKGVENTNGQDRNVTTNVMDEGQESTEEVEKTGELPEGLVGLHQKMDQLLEPLAKVERPRAAHRCWRRSASRSPLVELSAVGGPRVSVSSSSTARTCSPTFRWSEVRFEGLVGCRVVVFLEVDVAKSTADEMKYRAIELRREQDRTPWRRPPWLSCGPSGSSTRPVDNEDGRHGRADQSCQ